VPKATDCDGRAVAAVVVVSDQPEAFGLDTRQRIKAA
jgi:hypothetical protein